MGLFGRDERATSAPQASSTQTSRPGAQVPTHQPGDRSVIAASIQVEGTLSGSGQILVDGRVRGSIEGRDEVVVATRGRVDATVHGRLVMVAGRVTGDITADEKIELEPTAQVNGNMTAPRILIRDGATFRGKVNMKPPEPRGELTTSSARKSSAKPDQG